MTDKDAAIVSVTLRDLARSRADMDRVLNLFPEPPAHVRSSIRGWMLQIQGWEDTLRDLRER